MDIVAIQPAEHESAASEGHDGTTERLPGRDFSKVYEGDAKSLAAQAFAEVLGLAQSYADDYKGRVAGLAPAALAEAIRREEHIQQVFDRGATPAWLINAANLEDPLGIALASAMDDADAAIEERMAFFDAELARLGEAELTRLADAPELAPWRRMFLDFARAAKHVLSPDEERILAALNPDAAWVRAYDQESTALRFRYRGTEISEDDLTPLLDHPDIAVRRDARDARIAAYSSRREPFAAIISEIVRLSNVEDSLRGYDRPEAHSLLDAGLAPSALDALLAATKSRIGISHRWTAAKLAALGIAAPADRAALDAPVPGAHQIRYGWNEALAIVADAWERSCPGLSPRMARLLDGGLIDAEPRPGKMGGAFCLSDSLRPTPFVHLSWYGRIEDLFTLAHELGHALHNQLMFEAQAPSMTDAGRVMAETASTFSEGIVFDLLLERAKTPMERRALTGTMLEERLGTVVGQIAFHTFERRVHDARRTGALTPVFLEAALTEAERWYKGPAVLQQEEQDGALWPRVSHFFHSPFYVWTYAAADTVSGALLRRAVEPGFEPRFEALLRAGGSQAPAEALAPFGIDVAHRGFWASAFDRMEAMLVRFEED